MENELDGGTVYPESEPRTLPFDFGQKPANRVEDFERLRHARAYITHCAKEKGLYLGKVEDKRVLREAMAALGSSRIEKFQRNRARWNEAEGPIPVSYLRFIGVGLDLLGQAVELDAKEWEEAVRRISSPCHFTLRYIPGVYGRKELPEGLTKEEAISAVRAFQEANMRVQGCSIHWPGLKSVYIKAGRPTWYAYYGPGDEVGA